VTRADRGSTIPLILGFFLVALLVVGGAVALADGFVQQRDLQDLCDGAAAAAAASQLDLTRGAVIGQDGPAPFVDAAQVDAAVAAYLSRDAERRTVRVRATLTADRRTLVLHCRQRRVIAFGAMFGRPTITHTATSSVQAPVRH
jgi:hypothetical protein